ncbi:hypothetical protein [Vulcanococcus limneticus]|uniref:hypothetical protein n=1 Tax=Vulcanococcus limneticus TaxID=2170428 RepID=UPI00398C008B
MASPEMQARKLPRDWLASELQILADSGLLFIHGEPCSDLLARQPGALLDQCLDLLVALPSAQGWPIATPLVLASWLLPQLPQDWESPLNPLLAYLLACAEAFAPQPSPHPLLDPTWLEIQLPAASASSAHGVSASYLARYLQLSAEQQQRIGPNPWFDPCWYLSSHPDLREAGIQQPFLHYLHHGGVEGRAPSPIFDATRWISRRADCLLDPNPLVDFLLLRRTEPSLAPEPVRLPGHLQHLTATGDLIGWAWDPGNSDPIAVQIWWNNVFLAEALADCWRSELEIEGLRDGRVGYRIPLPADQCQNLVDAALKDQLEIDVLHPDGRMIGDGSWRPSGIDLKCLYQWAESVQFGSKQAEGACASWDGIHEFPELMAVGKAFDRFAELLDYLERSQRDTRRQRRRPDGRGALPWPL